MNEIYLLWIYIACIPIGCAIGLLGPWIFEWIRDEIDWALHHKEYERIHAELAETIVKLNGTGWDLSKLEVSHATIDNLEATYISADKIARALFEAEGEKNETAD